MPRAGYYSLPINAGNQAPLKAICAAHGWPANSTGYTAAFRLALASALGEIDPEIRPQPERSEVGEDWVILKIDDPTIRRRLDALVTRLHLEPGTRADREALQFAILLLNYAMLPPQE